MRKNNANSEHIEGRIYEQELAIKKVQKQGDNYGKEFISGTLSIATDEECLNVIPVHFTYVTEYTKNGAKNQTYAALQKIITEGKTCLNDGKDAATKVKVDTALSLNDFYNQNNELVSVKQNEGGFVTIVNELCDEKDRNTFQFDMFITSAEEVEANPEKGIDNPYVSLRGAVFSYKNDILPIDLVVKNANGMKYFMDLGISGSEPVFTKVWGKIMSATVVTERVEESAFGEAAVQKYEKKTKEWVVTGTATVPYDYGDEEVLTADDVRLAMQNRDVYLAEVKKRKDDYEASKNAGTPSGFSAGAMNMPSGSIPEVKTGSFSF